jgi:nicotinate-nucleotide adenylyltransferase
LRLGILGGAFSPPHIGHLVCAQEALVQLELDKVLWVPVREAPHRELKDDPGPEQRLKLVELAIDGDERFEGSRIELDREGPSYTVDTLRALAGDDELFLLLGGDQAAALESWREPEEVLSLATLAVFERLGWTRNSIGIKIGRLRGAERVRYLDMPLIQLSSSGVRRRIADGRPIRYLVPEGVAAEIEARGLYGAASAARATAEAGG